MTELIEKDQESRLNVFKKFNLNRMTELIEKDPESRLSVLYLSYQSSRLKNII